MFTPPGLPRVLKTLFHVVYPFGFSVMFSSFPYFAPKLFCFPCILLFVCLFIFFPYLLVGFFRCFRKSCFVCRLCTWKKNSQHSQNDSHVPNTRMCPWCNGYRRRNWKRRHEFKSWTDCISHSTNTLGKEWIQLFSLQLWVNSRTV